MTKPTVARMVHYVSYGTPGGEYTSQCRAAVVTAVRETVSGHERGAPYVDLCVLNPTGQLFDQNVPYFAGDPDHVDAAPGKPVYRGGTWHWPEREEAK
jgi:hypothetical protein